MFIQRIRRSILLCAVAWGVASCGQIDNELNLFDDNSSVGLSLALPRGALADQEGLRLDVVLNGGPVQSYLVGSGSVSATADAWTVALSDIMLNQVNTIELSWYVDMGPQEYTVSTKPPTDFFADTSIGFAELDSTYISDAYDHDNDGISNLQEIEDQTFPTLPMEMSTLRQPTPFSIGSPPSEVGRYDNEDQITVQINSFEIGKYEVTYNQYDEFTRSTGRPLAQADLEALHGRGDRPVTYVSYEDAVAFARWKSTMTGRTYRLPTEAEWEYAARGGSLTAYAHGNQINLSHANIFVDSSVIDPSGQVALERTVNVGEYPPNAFDIYDMHGNVNEWTCSFYQAPYAGAESACVVDSTGRRMVVRGGSWAFFGREARSANRGWLDEPAVNSGWIGFRLVREL